MGVNRDQGGGGLLMAPLFVTRYHTSQSDTQTRGSCMENFIKSNNKMTPLCHFSITFCIFLLGKD